MALPVDIHITFQEGRGFAVAVNGAETDTTGMNEGAILWGVVQYLFENTPGDERVRAMRASVLQVAGNFLLLHDPVLQPQMVQPQQREFRRSDLSIQQQIVECPAPDHDCCICMQSGGGQWVRLHSCNHTFHADCIESWLVYKRHNNCPICRHDCTLH